MTDCATPVRFGPDFGPCFVVTVDTEEEFDWTRPLSRTGHGVNSLAELARFQAFCEAHGVAPIYLMDYPVAMSDLAAAILRDPVAQGQAEVGVQLHPWVNPPFDEEVTPRNSFAGHLPHALERAKFLELHRAITHNLGAAPRIYRAGRYGIGPNTAAILREAGIAIDTSVRPHFDYSAEQGPDYRDLPLSPWWVGPPGGLMELPLTTVFTGPLRRAGPWLHPRLPRRLRGILARLRLLERIPLTPEGVTIAEAMRATEVAIDAGLPVLVLSFHSPSLAPGHTPYVRSQADVEQLYAWWQQVFALMRARGVRPASLHHILDAADLA